MANFVWGDRVKDTASSVSGSTVTLNSSPPAGFQGFGAIGDTNVCVYEINDGTNWEVTYGAYTASGTTLARASTPIASSNAGAQVASFSGTVNVFCTEPAAFVGAPFFGIQAGRITTNAFLAAYGSSQAVIPTGTVVYAPLFIEQWFTSATLYFILNTAVSGVSTVDLGLYSSKQGAPAARLGQQTGINTGTSATTGTNATSPIAMPSPQPPGLYWGAYVAHTNAPTVDSASGTHEPAVDVIGRSGVISGQPARSWTETAASLPSTPGTLTAQGAGNNKDIWFGVSVSF